MNGLVDYGKSVFNMSQSGCNNSSNLRYEGESQEVWKYYIIFIFIYTRMIQVLKRKEKWNGLPTIVKTSPNVDMCKMNLYI